MKNKLMKKQNGITLVALVVTIVVLLILAGITLTYVLGDNSIFKLAQDAKNKTEEAMRNEQGDMNRLVDYADEALGKVKIPEGLEVGATVTYNPNGTYNWQAKYCSSIKTETTNDVILNSSEANFKISEWKVLSIDELTGKVEMVPSSPTAGTVYLGEAQGYNNGVKLLNDACRQLYGNDAKGITARSINIEDIEKYMTDEALTGEDGAYNYVETPGDTKYGDQIKDAYTSSKNYPVIYAKEKKAVITPSLEKIGTLDLSDTPNNFIERSEGTSSASNMGVITTATSIKPYQTYWYKDNTKVKYYDLIIPEEATTNYWISSRCISVYTPQCSFRVRGVWNGGVHAYTVCDSSKGIYTYSLALFPVVTLSAKLIKSGETAENFTVNL